MRNPGWWRAWIALAVLAGIAACRPIPTRPTYRSPVISAVDVFPTLIGQGDSVMVTLVASDPDGDSLVFDWVTDSRLRIKDAPRVVYIYNTPSPSHVFYRSVGAAIDNVAWIDCSVRDGRGGLNTVRVLIPLRD